MQRVDGNLNVRIPAGLHQALLERAAEEGVNLSQLVIALLAGGLGWATDGKPMRLTKPEVSALAFAAGSVGDDIEHMGLSEEEKRAYKRGMSKLKAASAQAAAPTTNE